MHVDVIPVFTRYTSIFKAAPDRLYRRRRNGSHLRLGDALQFGAQGCFSVFKRRDQAQRCLNNGFDLFQFLNRELRL